MTKKPELLLPAKGMDELKVAVNFGADAVYIGARTMGLRAKAKNFSFEELSEAIDFAHKRGVRVYVTANIIARNEDIDRAQEFFRQINIVHPDALLIADLGLFEIAKKICPDIELHVSTQANNTNYATFNFWHSLGAKRVVAARELSLDEIDKIRSKIPPELEIEAFVHGAMCISYSGRCLLSNYFTGRDANRGECSHPCRWKYALMEETRPGQYLPIQEDERGSFILNSRDLCMVEYIPQLVRAKIDSFKIEGRMKTALYVAAAARTYRRAIDDFFNSEEDYKKNIPWYLDEIKKCTTRRFSTGFFFGHPDETSQIYDESTYTQEYVYLGSVEEVTPGGEAVIYQKNKFSVGDKVEIMRADGMDSTATVENIRDESGARVESAPHPKEKLFVQLSEHIMSGDLLRARR